MIKITNIDELLNDYLFVTTTQQELVFDYLLFQTGAGGLIIFPYHGVIDDDFKSFSSSSQSSDILQRLFEMYLNIKEVG